MVGRLVEQQQIRLQHEQPREMRAHDPAAAHRARRPVEIALAKGEAGEDALRLRLELPAAVLVENVQRFVISSSSPSARLVALDHLLRLDQPGEIARPVRARFRRRRARFPAGESRAWRFSRSTTLPSSGEASPRMREKSVDFARAIRADEADAIAAIHLERDILEEDAPGESFG